jgi:hypothetical protein
MGEPAQQVKDGIDVWPRPKNFLETRVADTKLAEHCLGVEFDNSPLTHNSIPTWKFQSIELRWQKAHQNLGGPFASC